MISKPKFREAKKGANMAHKCVFVVMLCVCLSAVGIAIWAQISQERMAVSLEELKAENNRLNRARIEALGEVEFLRSAIRRLDAALAEADRAVTEIEETYNARTEQIHDLPSDWLSCALPAGVCDMFAGYTVPGGASDSVGIDAAVPAANNAGNADE